MFLQDVFLYTKEAQIFHSVFLCLCSRSVSDPAMEVKTWPKTDRLDTNRIKGQLDALTPYHLSNIDKVVFSGASVQQYLEKTGFPNFNKAIRNKIETHAHHVLRTASKETGVPILYSGYNRSCSVARGQALPGSDLDHWVILITGDVEAKTRLEKAIQKYLDPDLVNPGSLNAKFSFYTESEVLAVANKSWHAMMRGPETYDPQVARVGILLEIIRDGVALLDQLGSYQKLALQNTRLYRESCNLDQKHYIANGAPKPKYQYRNQLVSQFSTLTNAEKRLVIQILQTTIANSPVAIPNPLLRFEQTNPYYQQLMSLKQKGLLVQLDSNIPHVDRSLEMFSCRREGNHRETSSRIYLSNPKTGRKKPSVTPVALSNKIK